MERGALMERYGRTNLGAEGMVRGDSLSGETHHIRGLQASQGRSGPTGA